MYVCHVICIYEQEGTLGKVKPTVTVTLTVEEVEPKVEIGGEGEGGKRL
jgi:hypothetical protein